MPIFTCNIERNILLDCFICFQMSSDANYIKFLDIILASSTFSNKEIPKWSISRSTDEYPMATDVRCWVWYRCNSLLFNTHVSMWKIFMFLCYIAVVSIQCTYFEHKNCLLHSCLIRVKSRIFLKIECTINDLDARFTKSSTDNAVDINIKSIVDCNITSCNHHHLILGEGMHTHSLRPNPSSVFDYQWYWPTWYHNKARKTTYEQVRSLQPNVFTLITSTTSNEKNKKQIKKAGLWWMNSRTFVFWFVEVAKKLILFDHCNSFGVFPQGLHVWITLYID